MRVEYRMTVQVGGSTTFQHLTNASCCDGMTKAFGEFVDFPMEYGSGPPKCSIKTRSYSEWEYLPIDFCPFCGVKIECVEVERKRYVAKTRTIPAREETYYEEAPEAGPTP